MVRKSFALGDSIPSRVVETLGRARKKRCETLRSSLTVHTTAAAPAVYANCLTAGKQSNPFPLAVVVPMTFFSRSPDSSLFEVFVGDFGVEFLKNGEFEGVRRKA